MSFWNVFGAQWCTSLTFYFHRDKLLSGLPGCHATNILVLLSPKYHFPKVLTAYFRKFTELTSRTGKFCTSSPAAVSYCPYNAIPPHNCYCVLVLITLQLEQPCSAPAIYFHVVCRQFSCFQLFSLCLCTLGEEGCHRSLTALKGNFTVGVWVPWWEIPMDKPSSFLAVSCPQLDNSDSEMTTTPGGARYLCKILGYCSRTYVNQSPVALPADVCVLLVVQLVHGITTQIHQIYSFVAELSACSSIPVVPTSQQHTLQQRCRHATRGHPDVVSPRCALAVTRRPVAALVFCVRAATQLWRKFPDLADGTGLVWVEPASSQKNRTQSSATDTCPIAQTSGAWWEHFGHQVQSKDNLSHHIDTAMAEKPLAILRSNRICTQLFVHNKNA